MERRGYMKMSVPITVLIVSWRFLLFSRFLGMSALALGLASISVPVLAADTMMSTPSCSADSMHSAMAAMGSKISSAQPTGNPDKDYAQATAMLMQSQNELNAWEMKCGKNPQAMKMAGDMQQNLATMRQHLQELQLGG